MGRAVRRSRKGDFEVRISASERRFLAAVAAEMRELMADGDDPTLSRLFPVAYPDDEDRQTEYRLLVHDELRSSHLAALDALVTNAAADRLDEEQLMAWMRAVNGVRLVLGTRLDISEDGDERPTDRDDERASSFAVYDYLTWLEGEIVEALSG